MKEYITFVSILPIVLTTALALSDDELINHSKSQCFGLTLTVFLYGVIYILLTHAQINKYLAIALAAAGWAILFYLGTRHTA